MPHDPPWDRRENKVVSMEPGKIKASRETGLGIGHLAGVEEYGVGCFILSLVGYFVTS